ncbi:amidohydrolase family protein [Gemmatirosa kalamazoonensis]|nr:amidohydrolase family protein [Gemmatirosa kalamazoonensis]
MRRTALAAALAMLATAALPAQPAAPDDVLAHVPAPAYAAIVDVTVVPMDRERILEHQTVVVRDSRIVALGAARGTPVPAGAARIDGRGKFVAPALVDMHAHLSAGDESLGTAAGRQLALYLANGFATVRGLSAPTPILPAQLRLRDRVARGEVLGPTLYVAGPSLNGGSVTSPAAGVRMVDDAKRAGFDLLKTHGGLSAEAYDSVAAAAKRDGLALVGHVTPEYGLARAYAAGQQIEHLDGWIAAIVADGVAVPPGQLVLDPAVLARVDARKLDSVVRETVRRGIWNGPTLALFETLASDETPEQLAQRPGLRYLPAAEVARWAPAKAQILAAPAEGRAAFVTLRRRIVRALHDAGAKLLVGSDSPQLYMAPGDAALREIDAFVAAGLTPYAALEAATRNPAEWLGRTDAGTVAAGKRADLVLLDANPLVDTANLRKVAGLFVGGRWLDASTLAALRAGVLARVQG